MTEVLAAVLSLIVLLLTHWLKKEKTKLEKAREIVHKARAAKAKDDYYGQVRDTKTMEARNDALLDELNSIFSLRKKTDSSD